MGTDAKARIEVVSLGKLTDEYNAKFGEHIGWMCTKAVQVGWQLHLPSTQIREWVGEVPAGDSLLKAVSSVYGNETALILLSPLNRTVRFFNNARYARTNTPQWHLPNHFVKLRVLKDYVEYLGLLK